MLRPVAEKRTIWRTRGPFGMTLFGCPSLFVTSYATFDDFIDLSDDVDDTLDNAILPITHNMHLDTFIVKCIQGFSFSLLTWAWKST